jgi:Resolvase, N terminal domain
MKAICYCLVSTEKQARHGISLDFQRVKIRAYAELEDLEFVDIIADEGISSGSIKIRLGIQAVLEKVPRGEVSAVVVYKLDRLARDVLELAQANLRREGHLQPVGLIYTGAGLSHVVPFRYEGLDEKRISQNGFKQLLLKLEARAAIVVTESWLKPAFRAWLYLSSGLFVPVVFGGQFWRA